MEKKLNKDQLKAIKHKTGPLLIIAGAGTGKTTVITERIKYLISKNLAKPEEILALTFTEKASREMEVRVDEVMPYGLTQMWISTFHSFCDRVLRQEALNIGLDPRFHLMSESETIQLIRQNLFEFELNYFRPLGNPTKFVSGMLEHFSRLQDEDVTPQDYQNWVKKQKPSTDEEKLEVEKYKELAKAYQQYEELKVREGLFDYGDLIVKTLQLFRDRKNILNNYQNKFKYILVDEFQDTNFAQSQLVYLLANKNLPAQAGITVVGDDDQCLPSSALVSTVDGIKEIKKVKIGDKVITAVGKGHTSISRVARIFKQKKKRRVLTFVTEKGKRLVVTDNHKMFCFIPAHDDLKGYHFVYLMHKKEVGWRLGVTNNLPNRLRLERGGDLIIGIGSYETDAEARYYEAYYSAKYGIPTVPFSPRPNQAISGELLDRLFKEIDTESNIHKLAVDLKIELDSPQFLVGGVTRGTSRRVKINFEMCYRNYRSKNHKNGYIGNPVISHLVSLETSNPRVLGKLKEYGVEYFKDKKGMRVRKAFMDIRQAWNFAEELRRISNGIIDKKFKLGLFHQRHLTSRIVPASHVFPGMYLPVLNGKAVVYEKVISCTAEEKVLETYDLEIEKTHNFIADGIVVHNSIYRFRGAAISNILQFSKKYPKSKKVVLTQNYRSNQEILDSAYKLIQHNNPDRLEVVEKINKKLISSRARPAYAKATVGDPVVFIHESRAENEAEKVCQIIKDHIKTDKYDFNDFAILVRANNHAEAFIRALQRAGIPYQFLGPGRLFKQPEVMNLVAYLNVVANIEDSQSLYRILSLDEFDIAPIDVMRVANFSKNEDISIFEACERIEEINVTKDTKQKVNKIILGIVDHVNLAKKQTAGQILFLFLEENNLLDRFLNPDNAEADKKAKNIAKFFDKLKTYEAEHEDSSVTMVVDWIALSSELGESPVATDTDWTNIDAVNILTIHSSKGLEFPVVFLVNLVSQRFPSMERAEQIPLPVEILKEVLPTGDFHLQEERRLCYVGMTRAKDYLYLTAADFYGEGKREKKLSPFIYEALGQLDGNAKKQIKAPEQLSLLSFTSSVPQENKKLIKPNIDYLSYSQIETFQTCPLHYKLKYLVGIPTPHTPSESLGISVHGAIKDFYELIKLEQKPSQKLLLEQLEKNWITTGYKNKKFREKNWQRAVNYLQGFYKTTFNPNLLPTQLEQKFQIKLTQADENPFKIGGTIDRIDEFEDKIEIWDYKTGEKVPTQAEVDRNEQLTFYALAASEIYKKDLNLSLYYFEEQIKITTKRTQMQLGEFRHKLFEIRHEIEESDFACSGNYFCKVCDYKQFCQVDVDNL